VAVGGIAAKICGIPNIRRIGNEFDFGKKLKVRINHELLIDHYLTTCDFTVKKSVERRAWLNPNDFSVVYHGRNIQKFSEEDRAQQREKWEIPATDVVIGITGKLVKNKSVDHLIVVFQRLLSKYSDLKLVVTGKGPEEKALNDLADRLGIQDNVVFAGFSTTPLRSAAAYDIAVMTTQYESIPNVLIEYLAVGTPVVISDVSGISEVIVHGENGLLYEYGNLDELEKKLMLLIENPKIRKKLTKNALQTIRNKFSADKMIDDLESFYRRMIRK
jgi:glycosyltransferase involved in cell wall biosynthesis